MTDPPAAPQGGERGAATLVMLALVLVAVSVALLIADVSVYLGARARAQVAADAAALAAAPVTFRSFGALGSAVDEAREFAARNGGQLIECHCDHDASWRPREVTVLVEVPIDLAILRATEARAWSSAEFVPTDLADRGTGVPKVLGRVDDAVGQVEVDVRRFTPQIDDGLAAGIAD